MSTLTTSFSGPKRKSLAVFGHGDFQKADARAEFPSVDFMPE